MSSTVSVVRMAGCLTGPGGGGEEGEKVQFLDPPSPLLGMGTGLA